MSCAWQSHCVDRVLTELHATTPVVEQLHFGKLGRAALPSVGRVLTELHATTPVVEQLHFGKLGRAALPSVGTVCIK